MANIKSAKKRILVIEKKTARNKAIKSRTKTETKKLIAAIKEGDKTKATELLKSTISQIDSASSKGIYHKNNAARKKSRLTNLVNAM